MSETSKSSLVFLDMIILQNLIFHIRFTWRILFYPNLAVEEVSNYKLALGNSHFYYAEALLNHISSTAKFVPYMI